MSSVEAEPWNALVWIAEVGMMLKPFLLHLFSVFEMYLLALIAGTKYDCTGLSWLSSGGTNFVFRGILNEARDVDGTELIVIFKYTHAHR
jgi:hypothetical protein